MSQGDVRMTTRREVLVALGLCMLSTAVSSIAQQTRLWRIGFLFFGARPEANDPNFAAFVGGLRELGYVEGKNLIIDWRFAEGSYDRLAALAGDLVRSKVD